MDEKTGQTETQKSPTLKSEGQIDLAAEKYTQHEGQTKTEKSPPVNKGGRPPRNIPQPEKWTIKGIDRDTRAIIQKAASRAGKPLGRWFNEDLREFAQSQIKKGNAVPAKQEDLVTGLFDKLRTELKAEQSEELKSLRLAIENRPATFWEWLSGKKKS
ncbi:hypothetical protein Q0590_36345 [Rhodocytophaga aerolata]|uniref:Uncharacterized protein n=1 Tax=Rhodocytophaga aerolata TaxID=455078 RepID=A0ABT8RI67_9BACT|nr:hypothetical protein [Rhodocytophaga aerolata]MDO1451802.1 hypothetical protein [Rhodocytophaga aerolata]